MRSAGTGQIERQEDGETIGFLHGSTERALRVRDRQFDELIFIERDPGRCAELEKLRQTHPERRIAIEQGEANGLLKSFTETGAPVAVFFSWIRLLLSSSGPL